ncbi:short chain dehydrogenase [Colletotrichum truncatum]|uniref:Short chain dehydrogenase n=1 Tax=Colletotrichum truncatum TaxID=5467 RepID=A0ACC3YY22_COLTU|nr:short chain dehydrogenase [Colletotrichum truncatum]KAF6781200.1 short chain dehydrogenase [Colletotrichum truncatum]
MENLRGRVVFVAGGSTGLGKAIAISLAARGADVTVFARRQVELDKARVEIIEATIFPDQEIRAVSLDLSDASQCERIFEAQPRLPDALYCVAGGCVSELGFFTDVPAAAIDSCMRKNYLTSAYPSHALLRLWTRDDRRQNTSSLAATTVPKPNPKLRQIIFISSAAAFANVPGYVAYTPAKCAQRALADTLRQETAIYSNAASQYTIHCAFPGTVLTDTFFEEQKNKPTITKRMESTDGAEDKLRAKYPSAHDVAEAIVHGTADRQGGGDFCICTDFDTSVLWSSMIGPSPKRGWGMLDSCLGFISSFFVWPILWRSWKAMCTEVGISREKGESSSESSDI